MRRLFFLLLLILPSLAHSQEVVSKLDNAGLVTINEELRHSASGLKTLKGQIADILPIDLTSSSDVSGILPVANGGTGTSTGITSFNQFFTSNGTFTAPSGVTKVYVTMCSAGGGGGGAGPAGGDGFSGGGASGTCIINWPSTVTAGNSYNVVVGTGGPGGIGYTQNGTTGGTTSFNSISLTGGSGGNFGYPAGTAGTCPYRTTLSALGRYPGGRLCGDGGAGEDITGHNWTGAGGSSMFGIGGSGVEELSTGSNGVSGTGYASGGSGAYRNSGAVTYTGGAGTNGFVLIQW